MLLALLLVAPPAWTADSDYTSGDIAAMSFDVVVLRTLGAVRLLCGTGLWVPVTAFWPPLYKENYEQFIQDPYRFLFERPLGRDFAGG